MMQWKVYSRKKKFEDQQQGILPELSMLTTFNILLKNQIILAHQKEKFTLLPSSILPWELTLIEASKTTIIKFTETPHQSFPNCMI
jgi:hypothetical protein